MKDALLIQHVYKDSDHARMLEFCEPFHREYTAAHGMDYWCIYGGDVYSGNGDWLTLALVLRALRLGYKYVIKMDADAIIQDTRADLRDACHMIGACFDSLNCQPHYNSGVMYFEDAPEVRQFIRDLLSRAPGVPWNGGPMVLDQGELNSLIAERPGIVQILPNKWNCYAGTPCFDENEIIVQAYHGPNTIDYKLADMKRVKLEKQ